MEISLQNLYVGILGLKGLRSGNKSSPDLKYKSERKEYKIKEICYLSKKIITLFSLHMSRPDYAMVSGS